MPRATVDTQLTQRFELKSLEGGFVELRKLAYGERLKSKEMAMKIGIRGQQANMTMDAEFSMSDVAVFEFSKSIIGHNLEDHNGQALNFGDPKTVASLDAAVGQEIETLIDQFNTPKETGVSS